MVFQARGLSNAYIANKTLVSYEKIFMSYLHAIS